MKSTYYKQLAEYMQLAEQRKYNEVFYDKKRFEWLQSALCKRLERQLLRVDYMKMERFFNFNMKYAPEKIICFSRKTEYLLEKISLGESITESDFEGSYLEELILGIFTVPQMLGVIIGIVLFVSILI